MTRNEIRTRILRALNDSPTTPVFWSLSEIDDAIQEAQEVLAEEVPFVKRMFLLPRRAGTLVYQLPGVGTNILAPYRIWLPDLRRRLVVKTLADLDANYQRWLTVPGNPEVWCSLSWDQFLIWPPAGTAEGWLEVDCYCWPAALLDDDDEPELHPSSHGVLVPYGVGLGQLKSWDAQGTVQAWQQFFGDGGAVRAQADLRQMQERLWGRESHRGDSRD